MDGSGSPAGGRAGRRGPASQRPYRLVLDRELSADTGRLSLARELATPPTATVLRRRPRLRRGARGGGPSVRPCPAHVNGAGGRHGRGGVAGPGRPPLRRGRRDP